MATPAPDIETILKTVPHLKRGTGGVAAVLKNGELIGKKAWGYANLEQRIPMTTDTQFPICSISKQMICLTMESLRKDPTPSMREREGSPEEQFEAELKKLLPNLPSDSDLKVADLCNMQSGIRDYWAMTTLYGSQAEGPFSLLHDAPKALSLTKTFHFPPGTEYSYSNVNFHVLGRILENVSGHSLAQLLAARLFMPAGMTNATLNPNTFGLPLPIVGYEGNDTVGYFAATNRIEWAGDAGIAASLEDMIAYESYLDASLQDPDSVYASTSKQQHFRDGTEADYGFGLSRFKVADKEAIGHGGALRGFRHMRAQIPAERLAVVVLLNYETDPGALAEHIVKKYLSFSEPETEKFSPSETWKGDYLDPSTNLYIQILPGPVEKPGTVALNYGPGTTGELVKLSSPTTAENPGTKARLEGDALHVERVHDNRTLRATRLASSDEDVEAARAKSGDLAGGYRCEEVDSVFTVTGEDGALHGSFDGFLGRGPVWLMRCLGPDVWALGNPRSLDSTPPGDWTIVFKRGKGGKVEGVTIGCWLARGVEYVRV